MINVIRQRLTFLNLLALAGGVFIILAFLAMMFDGIITIAK